MCENCKDEKWVCENHPDKPWTDRSADGCECGAGMPCRVCGGDFAEEIDWGVCYTDTEQPLVSVAENPEPGQYVFKCGVYTFAAADASKELTFGVDPRKSKGAL